MPGLKANKKQGIDNIDDVMALRSKNNKGTHDNVIHRQPDENKSENVSRMEEQQQEEKHTSSSRLSRTSSLYEKYRESIGKSLRRRYDAGNPPRKHQELYREIVIALKGAKKDIVVLKPILENIEMSYATSARICSLLEEYGYLYFEKAHDEPGRLMVIEVLRDI